MRSFLVIMLLFLGSATTFAEDDHLRILVLYNETDHYIDHKDIELVEILRKGYVVYSIPENQVDNWLEAFNRHPSIDYAEVEETIQILTQPNDPLFSNQEKDFLSINSLQAWEIYSPQKRVNVAVIDSGVVVTHPDLQDNLVEGKNFVNSDAPTHDYDGHGTHVSGIIGAITNNNLGITSLNEGLVNIMPLKIFDNSSGSTIDLGKAIFYAADNNVEVINISLGYYIHSQYVYDAVKYAHQKDVLMIAAVGNDGVENIAFPAVHEEVIAVGAINSLTGLKTDFSNFGTGLEIVAPGEQILSTFNENDSLYQYMTGTSMATPFVSSLAAMIKAHEPSLSASQVRKIINNSATNLGDSYTYGNGLINAYEALRLIDTNNRIYGENAVDTSIEIAKKGWSNPLTLSEFKNNSGKYAVIATNANFPDSLSGTTLAGQLDAPLVLTDPNQLDEKIVNLLRIRC